MLKIETWGIRPISKHPLARSRERPFWLGHYYDFKVSNHDKFVEKLRYIHRNPVVRGLAASPEDWKWSSFRPYQTGVRGTVEIESEWTARERGWQLPEWMRNRRSDASTAPFSKGAGPGNGLKLMPGAPGPSPLGTGE